MTGRANFAALARGLANLAPGAAPDVGALDVFIQALDNDKENLSIQSLLLTPKLFEPLYSYLARTQDYDVLIRLLRIIARVLGFGESFSNMKVAETIGDLDGHGGLRQSLVRLLQTHAMHVEAMELCLECLADLQATKSGTAWRNPAESSQAVSLAIRIGHEHAASLSLRIRLTLFLSNMAATGSVDIRRHIVKEGGHLVGKFAQFACASVSANPILAELTLSLAHNLCFDDPPLAFEIHVEKLFLDAAQNALRVFLLPTVRLAAICVISDLAMVCQMIPPSFNTPFPLNAVRQVYDVLRVNVGTREFASACVRALARMTNNNNKEFQIEFINAEREHLFPNEPPLVLRVLMLWRNDMDICRECFELCDNVMLIEQPLFVAYLTRNFELPHTLLNEVIIRWSQTNSAFDTIVYPAQRMLMSVERLRSVPAPRTAASSSSAAVPVV